MKITSINNALTFYIFFPTKRKIHAELQGEQGGSCCNISIDKDVWAAWKKSFTSYWDKMEGNIYSSNAECPQFQPTPIF